MTAQILETRPVEATKEERSHLAASLARIDKTTLKTSYAPADGSNIFDSQNYMFRFFAADKTSTWTQVDADAGDVLPSGLHELFAFVRTPECGL